MAGGDGLGDHAAHRDADDMGALEPQRVHQPDRVERHIGELVGRVRDPSQRELGQAGHVGAIQPCRAAGVAVVEADDEEAAAC